jgi:type I restriction enzyme, S subunit
LGKGFVDYTKVGYASHDRGIRRYYLNENDFLISHINSYARIGNSARYNGEPPLLHGMNLIRVSPKPCVEPRFIEYLLKSKVFIGSMQRACKPAINQVSVTTTAIKAIRFPNPLLPEQKRIVKYLDEATSAIDAAIGKAQREIDLIHEYRTRLIADVVTGKVDVRHLAPPPGSEDLEETIGELEPLADTAGELDEEDLAGEIQV